VEGTLREVRKTWPVKVLAVMVLAITPWHGTLIAAGAGQRADVLIVELPTALTIYDIYQQRLPGGLQRSVPPFVPMIIEAERTTLSDGFTPCMKVLINGSTFYLLRDRSGEVSGLAGAGYSRVYRNVDIVADSLRVLDGHALHFTTADRSSTHTLRGGVILQRFFRDRSVFYCATASPAVTFGWVTLNAEEEGKVWEILRPAPSPTTLSVSMISSISERVDRANRIIRSLFAVFNRETGADHDPPQWTVRVGPDGLSCAPDDSVLAEHFQKSIHQLSKEVEAVLIGTPYIVVEEGVAISVMRRSLHEGREGS
jgi:hypothetical protein